MSPDIVVVAVVVVPVDCCCGEKNVVLLMDLCLYLNVGTRMNLCSWYCRIL